MAMYDYAGAMRRGKKCFHDAVSRGEYPYLPVLDDILAGVELAGEVSVGIMEVPLSRIVGTRTRSRSNSFAADFMPLLKEDTEFAWKWASVWDYQKNEGITDPVLLYEFMNRYYVQEGNKRVSVLKYVDSYSVSANVIRLLPKKTDELDVILYYEFLDFFSVSFCTEIWFGRTGGYRELLEAMDRKDKSVWTEDEREIFSSVYSQFSDVCVKYAAQKHIPANTTDTAEAFLCYVRLLGYAYVCGQTENQMLADMDQVQKELEQRKKGGARLLDGPAEGTEKKSLAQILLPFASGIKKPEDIKAGFIYLQTPQESGWAYAHELGRNYLLECFNGLLETAAYENARDEEGTRKAIDRAVADGCNVIFATAPQMCRAAVAAAITHPQVKIFNCSVNMSYAAIDTYCARLYEPKFLMGALAAAMSPSDRIGYIADYPIYGIAANINAFAIGAGMVNPRARIHLEWSGLLGPEKALEKIEADGICVVSGDDMIMPKKPSRRYGLFIKNEDGTVKNLATSVYDWGRFYEKMLTKLMTTATHGAEGKSTAVSTNYWWGMSADVVDIVTARDLPASTARLIEFLKQSVKTGSFHPFFGRIQAQNGVTAGEKDQVFTPQQIINTRWLCENVDGRIPASGEFPDTLQPFLKLQGMDKEEMEKDTHAAEGRI